MAAESKTKTATNGTVNGNTKASFKGTKLYETIRNMVSSANAVSSELSNLPDLEKLMESEKRLRKEVEDKNAEIEKVRQDTDKEIADKNKEIETIKKETEEQIKAVRKETNEEIGKIRADLEAEKLARHVLITDFEARAGVHDQTKAEGTAASQKLAEALQNLQTKEGEVEAARQRVAELQQASDKSLAQVEALNVEKDKIMREKKLLSADLQSREAEIVIFESDLHQLQRDVGVNLLKDYTERELNQFRRDVEAFAEESRSLVVEFFKEPDNTLNTISLPQQLDYLKQVPLPRAGSTPDLRCLVAQAIIAKYLRSHIFQPFFLPPDVHGAGSALLDYLSEDVQRATIFRCQILAACQRNGSAKVVANIAKDAVYRELCAFVPATRYLALQQRLTKFFEDGAKLWGEVQRSRQFILSESLEDEDIEEFDDETQRPRLWEEYGTRSRSTAGGPGEVVATLFPQIVIEVNDDIVNILHPGVGLWSDQTVVLAATQAQARGQVNGRVNVEGARPHSQRRRSSSSAPSGRP
ncbi:RNA polymerase rpb1 c-terminal repeat domain protein [Colletotrichum truncatum]|uniref:RNA polymerase rpb1 c-terminal repeat domain protein n=1 Tax=Colletotrichum truncatum TaxID=5467 RepID=A0ACC3YQB7_COLTU|nr:RNA polymerase rpb1 c-terminal repeat domain protein [Colletotrichum truncatum]KAF6796611.1 RNA polymerase rpb1 c-terminal repeat domain protein [Colletotrichum truncatum]